MKNIMLRLKFVGTNYHGWQIQKNGITVQECLSVAIFSITGEKVNIIGCGRTDAGVHSDGYAASFITESSVPPERFSYALNSVLPEDIVCVSSCEVSDSFDAARSAILKHYTYRILNSEFANPFISPFVYHVKTPLDVDLMKSAAGYFCGTHDFLGFASAGFSVKTTVRTVFSLKVSKENNIIYMDVLGDGFLYNMVRIIAGTLISVGNCRIAPEELPEIIKSRNRKRAGTTAPAKGLCLTEVFY